MRIQKKKKGIQQQRCQSSGKIRPAQKRNFQLDESDLQGKKLAEGVGERGGEERLW